MSSTLPARVWIILTVMLAGGAARAAYADAVSAVAVLRAGGCGGRAAISGPLRHSSTLDKLAAQWAQGEPLVPLATHQGYAAGAVSGVHVRAGGVALAQQLSSSSCAALSNPALREIGSFERAPDTWLVLARGSESRPAAEGQFVHQHAAASSTPAAPMAARPPQLSVRALELVNEVRARGTRCGAKSFAPAPPLNLSGTLGTVALGHASDMAEHGYFEHQDLTGHSPADRVRAIGYKERLVGENIAYGPESVDEVMRGWLDSPGHCENIMDPRFAEMGLALVAGHGARHGLYWVQVLAQPRV
jgi:uncharacterized protein YkwD